MYPWHGDDAFLEVMKVIFPNADAVMPSVEAYELARDRLILWQIKSPSSHYLPELEATLSLISAVLKDRKITMNLTGDTNEPMTNKCYDINTFYGMSIVKFCNLLPYYEMNKKKRVRRVIKASRKTNRDLGIALDMPTWVLECRHATCHSSNSSLILLRQANHFCLTWIFKNFWSKVVEEEQENRTKEDSFALSDRLEKWIAMPAGRKRNELGDKITSTVANQPEKSFPLIVDILVRESSFKLPRTVDLGVLPADIARDFGRIVQFIHSIDNLELFLYHLVNYFTHRDSRKSRVSVLWFKAITKELCASQSNGEEERKFSLPQLDPEVANVVWQRLLYRATKKLNKYLTELVDHLSGLIPEYCVPPEALRTLKQLAINATIPDLNEEMDTSEANGSQNGYHIRSLDDLRAKVEQPVTRMELK